MRTRSLLLAAGMLVLASAAGGQPPPTAPRTAPPPTPAPPAGGVPRVVPEPPTITPEPVPLPLVPDPAPGERIPPLISPAPLLPPAEKSVEQLLKELEAVQAEKAALLKREADLKAAVQKKLEAIQRQADKLGAGKAPPPDAGGLSGRQASPKVTVGRIVVEGAANQKAEMMTREVLEKAGLTPGAVYHRKALDAAGERLTKAGLTRVNLETSSAGPGSLDIRVRFAPEGDR